MHCIFRIAAAATALGGASVSGALAVPVTFGTNWLAQAEHGGFYQAVADGSYAQCGLEVTIMPGGPQGSLRPLLLAGKIDFYMGGNLLQAFSAVEQAIPLRVVAASFQKEPQVVMSHPGQGLDTWEELKNAEQYIIGDEGAQSFLLWMAEEYGFDPGKRVPYTFNPAPFMANPKSIQQGYVTSEPYAIEREGGFMPNLFLLADYGFATYATTIEAMQETIDKRPDVVQCFVDGSARGWYNYLYGDNKAANEAIKKDNPDITDEQIAFSVEKLKEFGIVDSGDAEKLGIGAMTDEHIKSFYDTMVKAKVVAPDIDISRAYTLQFVNKGVRSWTSRSRYRQIAPTAGAAPGAAAAKGQPLMILRGVGMSFSTASPRWAASTLEIREGDFLSLLGPSGCGKSTALRLIAGLSTPTSGLLDWQGGSASGRSRIGFVFQEPTLLPWATVFDNVWLPLRLRGISRERAAPAIRDMLRRVHLEGFEAAVPRELSGGMKMRVSIARGLVTKPRLLLMDEPFAALDEITRFKLNADLLELWGEERFTVVFVTHSVFESVFLSNRIAVMAARPGRVFEEIPVDAAYPRGEDFRTAPEYAALCRRTSAVLGAAMGPAHDEGAQ